VTREKHSNSLNARELSTKLEQSEVPVRPESQEVMAELGAAHPMKHIDAGNLPVAESA